VYQVGTNKGINLRINLYSLRVLLHYCMLVKNFTNGKLLKILISQHIKRVNNLLCHEVSVHLRQETLLNRKYIKQATCMSITWENFGIKLFCFLGGKTF